MGLEYFCFEGDGLWNAKDEDLIELAKSELGQLGLADPTKVIDGTVVRQQKAYPVYDSVYAEHLKMVRSHIDLIPNLHTVGRNGMHKYNNADHSMLTSMMAVANMRGASHDVWAVNTDFEYHEEQKIEHDTSRALLRPRSRSPAWAPRDRGVRIGVDATCWANARGYGRFARELMATRSATSARVCARRSPTSTSRSPPRSSATRRSIKPASTRR